MRIYVIGSDGITLCHKPPAKVNDGEIAVASNEELHAAPLSAKRLLALWNALLGVEKRKKVGDRDVLIDQLWSAIELLPDPELQRDPKRPSKQDVVIAMLRQPEGATVTGPYKENDPFHEPLVTYAYLAGVTKNLGLVQLRFSAFMNGAEDMIVDHNMVVTQVFGPLGKRLDRPRIAAKFDLRINHTSFHRPFPLSTI
jgi:hypothetical protein